MRSASRQPKRNATHAVVVESRAFYESLGIKRRLADYEVTTAKVEQILRLAA